MARYVIDFTYLSTLFFQEGSVGKAEAHFVNFRDRFRNQLPPTFIVSDIFEWFGGLSSPTSRAWAFLIKKGLKQWLIVLPSAAATSGTYARLSNLFSQGDSSIFPEYFRLDTGSDPSSTSGGGLFVHYNCGRGEYQVGFDDPNTLTFIDGDFQPPSVSPYTDFASFMPGSDLLRGVVLTGGTISSATSSNTMRLFFVVDDTLEFLAVYSFRRSFLLHTFQCFGDILVPYDDTDQDKNASAFFQFTYSTSSGVLESSTFVEFFRTEDGLRAVGSGSQISADTPQSYSNAPQKPGQWAWDTISVFEETSYKGWIHRDALRVIGTGSPSISDFYRAWQTPHDALIKASNRFAYPWASSAPAMPYPESDYRQGYDYRTVNPNAPPITTGLLANYDALQLQGYSANDPVEVFEDAWGGYHAIQSSFAARATYNSNVAGSGTPGLEFSGAQYYLLPNALRLNTNQPLTFIMVGTRETTGTGFYYGWYNPNRFREGFALFHLTSLRGSFRLGGGFDATSSNLTFPLGRFTQDTSSQGGGQSYDLRINQQVVASGFSGADTPPDPESIPAIGAALSVNGVEFGLIGEIQQILVYESALSVGDMDTILYPWLQQRWNL